MERTTWIRGPPAGSGGTGGSGGRGGSTGATTGGSGGTNSGTGGSGVSTGGSGGSGGSAPATGGSGGSGGSAGSAGSGGTGGSGGAGGSGGSGGRRGAGDAQSASEAPPAAPGNAPYGCAGCKRIFDGATLNGWHTAPGSWEVKEGALSSTGKNGDIYTAQDYGSYRIFFQVKQIKGDHKPCTTLFGKRPADPMAVAAAWVGLSSSRPTAPRGTTASAGPSSARPTRTST